MGTCIILSYFSSNNSFFRTQSNVININCLSCHQVHENRRVYADRLISQTDRDWLDEMMGKVTTNILTAILSITALFNLQNQCTVGYESNLWCKLGKYCARWWSPLVRWIHRYYLCNRQVLPGNRKVVAVVVVFVVVLILFIYIFIYFNYLFILPSMSSSSSAFTGDYEHRIGA